MTTTVTDVAAIPKIGHDAMTLAETEFTRTLSLLRQLRSGTQRHAHGSGGTVASCRIELLT